MAARTILCSLVSRTLPFRPFVIGIPTIPIAAIRVFDMQWEYKNAKMPSPSATREEHDRLMQSFGDEGWEAYHAQWFDAFDNKYYRVFFKRPKMAPEPYR